MRKTRNQAERLCHGPAEMILAWILLDEELMISVGSATNAAGNTRVRERPMDEIVTESLHERE